MIPIFSPRPIFADVDVRPAIERVLNRQSYVLGPEVLAFETEFARYLGVAEVVTCANGTDALELGLRAVGVQNNDRVALVANAGFYASTAIHAIRGIPLYVDVDPVTLTLSPFSWAAAMQFKPKAVVVTHLYGQLAEIEAVRELAKSEGIPVIEDCAQAHGAKRGGQLAGSFAEVGCFSFYPTKNLGALGDGGAVACQSREIADRLRSLRQYGWSSKYFVEIPDGRNSRLDELQAAILRDRLPRLDEWNNQRRKIAKTYVQAFADLPLLLPASLGQDYVAHLFVIRVKNRRAFREYLKEQGIQTEIHYPVPDQAQRAYPITQPLISLEHTATAAEEIVTLPCYPGLGDQDLGKVVETVRNFYQQT